MNTDGDPEDLGRLRTQAEKKLQERMERLKELSSSDVRDLVQELGTH